MFFLSQSLGLVEAPQRKIPTFLNFMLFNSVLMLAVAGCGGRGGQALHRAGTVSAAEGRNDRSSLPLIPSEADLNLGQVAPASQKSYAIWLTNRSAAPVEIAEIVTSCDCLEVELPKRLLAPGQRIEGRIKLGLRKEPQFRGNLGILVEGKGKKGETLFEMEVHVAVAND
jgi:hypothetical protein